MRRRHTTQRGQAATKGARVCDPQELCRPPNVLTNPAHRSLSTCCGSQSRAPQSRRSLRRFGQILIDYKSALPDKRLLAALPRVAVVTLSLVLSLFAAGCQTVSSLRDA